MEDRILFFICIIMKSKTIRFLSSLFPCLLTCSIGHAYEQDNWYLANEWNSGSNSRGVAYYEDNTTGTKQIYVTNTSSDNIKVYDLNGSLARTITIASNRNDPYNLCLDANGTIYIGERYAITCLDNDGTFRWRTGKNASISNGGTSGSGNGEFDYATGITLGPDENLYVADKRNERIQVLDKNGTFVREFGSGGTAPGQLDQPKSLSFLPDGNLVIRDERKLHWFQADGSFVRRIRENDNDLTSGMLATSRSGEMITYISRLHTTGSHVYDVYVLDAHGSTIARFTNSSSSTYESGWHYCFTPNGDIIVSTGSKIQVHKRAFRTKGMPVPNVIPQPAIRSVSQRAGTNILDLDFEIIDSDDATATVGILAHCGSDKLVPQAWTDGTDSKIGVPIATNQVHRVSWDVKQDWTTSTGEIKFEILCQDANRTKPVDLHFLTLPLPDGNLTISRSPLKSSDFINYAKYLLATGQAQIESNESDQVIIPAIETNATEVYFFTNAGATGRIGPTEAQLIAEYNGTNLQGLVTTGWKAGYQKWTVPATGSYWIEALGARGGYSQNHPGGSGTFVRGKFNLTAGTELNIVVGQAGINFANRSAGASGGGGTFVIADTNNTPLIIAGGGGGGGGEQSALSLITTGQNGRRSQYSGGISGSGGIGSPTGGGGGFLSDGTCSGYSGQEGLSYQNGLLGGVPRSNGKQGGFGGGGASHYEGWKSAGGGGGYSGGGGGQNNSPNIQGGGSGGSFNSGTQQVILAGVGGGHGLVQIYRSEGISPTFPKVILTDNSMKLPLTSYNLILALGSGYRFATSEEVTKAREAATPGSVNNWTATRQIKPRNLPGNVNEYGFDVSTISGLWVIKE